MLNTSPIVFQKVVARKTGGPGRRTWEVGIPASCRSTDKCFGERLTTGMAHERAKFVNRVVEWFMASNKVTPVGTPVFRRKHRQQAIAYDITFINIIQQWLNATDALEKETEGSITDHIILARDHIKTLLQNCGFAVRNKGGIWHVSKL